MNRPEVQATAEQLVLPATISKGLMPGACRSGGDNRGKVVHLIDNPGSRPVHLLGPALCGAMPHFDWSDNLPSTQRICPRCQRKLARHLAQGSGSQPLRAGRLLQAWRTRRPPRNSGGWPRPCPAPIAA